MSEEEDKIHNLQKAIEKAKKMLCQACNGSFTPKDCRRFPCWRILVIKEAQKGD